MQLNAGNGERLISLPVENMEMLEHVTGRYVHRINPMLVAKVVAYKRRNAGAFSVREAMSAIEDRR
jgi:hypothetical protein